MHRNHRRNKRGERKTSVGISLQYKNLQPLVQSPEGLVLWSWAVSNGPATCQFCLQRRSKSSELKSVRAALGSKVRTCKNFASNINCWGKVRVNGGNREKAGHRDPLLPQRCSPGSAQGFRLWASEWVIALVFQIWKFATSASQIKIEMSFATMAKKQFYIS